MDTLVIIALTASIVSLVAGTWKFYKAHSIKQAPTKVILGQNY